MRRSPELAARRVHALVTRCDPVPVELAREARAYIDEYRIRDPYNWLLTLDGRVAREAWGDRPHRGLPLPVWAL